ncbi:MAG: AbrB family transcriptional regulator [Selenomonadaceae bacterium]|nr:AbrB family transcriptional regulator [Selenomonadaceae bacterium]
MHLVKTFCFSAVGGFLLSLIHAPLPWLLGPLAVTAMTGYYQKKRVVWPVQLRDVSQLLLGYAMGRAFNAETAALIVQALPLMLLAAIMTVCAGLISAWLLLKRSDINLTSCLLGCVPGGLTQMVMLADELPAADLTAVTILQTVRMLSTVAVIPFLTIHVLADADAQAAAAAALPPPADWSSVFMYAALAVAGMYGAKLIRIPVASLIGPILATGAYLIVTGETAPLASKFWLSVAQIGVGTYIGAGIDVAKIRSYNGYWSSIFEGIIIVLACSMLMALGLRHLTGMGLTTAFLGCAPGGLAEMGVTALAVGADSAMMTAYQMTRLLFIMLVYPSIVKQIISWQAHTAPAAKDSGCHSR